MSSGLSQLNRYLNRAWYRAGIPAQLHDDSSQAVYATLIQNLGRPQFESLLADVGNTSVKDVQVLETWMKSYKPEELFDEAGRLIPELGELAPKGEKRMSANPHTNGGMLLKDLKLPDFREYAVDVPSPGTGDAEATRVMGKFLRNVMKMNLDSRNFRLVSPDESNSNRWQDVLEVTNRTGWPKRYRFDDHLNPDGRLIEVLSEHQCEGWLEGYLLTGRHGLFNCYEAFIHIIDSMFNQHSKWLKVTRNIPWRRPMASLNLPLTSHVSRRTTTG